MKPALPTFFEPTPEPKAKLPKPKPKEEKIEVKKKEVGGPENSNQAQNLSWPSLGY